MNYCASPKITLCLHISMYLSSDSSSLDVLCFQLYFFIPLFPYFQTNTTSIFLFCFVFIYYSILPFSFTNSPNIPCIDINYRRFSFTSISPNFPFPCKKNQYSVANTFSPFVLMFSMK